MGIFDEIKDGLVLDFGKDGKPRAKYTLKDIIDGKKEKEEHELKITVKFSDNQEFEFGCIGEAQNAILDAHGKGVFAKQVKDENGDTYICMLSVTLQKES